MKSYTDLEQSKKLKKILLPESADMAYDWFVVGEKYSTIPQCRKFIDDELPCWSLAALFSVIPKEIFDGEYIINITEGLDYKWVITYDSYNHRDHSYYGVSASADDLIDACYEIILKLHERKLL